MASVFSPSEFNIGFEQPVVDRSSTVFSDIGSSLMKGFDTAATASIKAAKANSPTYSQTKDENEKLMLAKYSTGLGDIWNDPDYSEAQKRLLTNTFKLSFANSGIDTSGSEFNQVDQLITGDTGENLQFSDNELIIEDLLKTTEGQAEILLARLELDAGDLIQSTDNIVNVLRRKEAIELQYNNIVVDNDVDFTAAEPQFRQKLTDFMTTTKHQVEVLEKEGVVITEQMLAGAYSQFVSIKLDLLSKIPSTVTSAKRSGIDSLLETTDELFKGLGLKEENGAIVFNRDQSVYDLQGKAKAIIAALEMENTIPSNILAIQITESNFQLDPATFASLTTKMQDLKIIDLQPKAFVEAELIVSDSLTKTFNNVRDFLNPYDPLADPSVSEIRIDQLDKEKALSLLPEDKQAQWKALDNTQSWKLFNFLATSSKGFNSNNIREDKDGKLTQGLYTNLIGLSLAFETVDFKTDPSSTLGIKEGINANLPRLLNILESVDPVKGESARSMLFRSLATSKVQYDARIATQQNQTPIIFNKQTGLFELDELKMKGSLKENRIVKSIVRDFYGGDLTAALANGFEDALAKNVWNQIPGGPKSASRAMQITATNFKDVSELADLMATSTYLTKFADSISPETYKSFFADAERMKEVNLVAENSKVETSNDLKKKLGVDPVSYNDIIENNGGTLKGNTKVPMVVVRGIESKPSSWGYFSNSDIEFERLPMDRRIPVVANWKDGQKYEGQVVNGKPDGSGTKTAANGSTWSGSFRQGTANGQGIFTDTKGQKWYGEWKNGAIYNADWSEQSSELFPNGLLITNGVWSEPDQVIDADVRRDTMSNEAALVSTPTEVTETESNIDADVRRDIMSNEAALVSTPTGVVDDLLIGSRYDGGEGERFVDSNDDAVPTETDSITDAQRDRMSNEAALVSTSIEDKLFDRLVVEEGEKLTAYKLKGETFYTIGYGHYGSDVKQGDVITSTQAKQLLKNDIASRLPAIKKALPDFVTFSIELQEEIGQSWFRGGIAGSAETIKLINQGKFTEASVEFLDNDEYRTTTFDSVKKRMEALADALAAEQ